MTHRGVTRREGGFTLVEMLVAVVIEAMIVGALAAAFIGIVRGTSQVNQSLSQSGDARIAAAYIISDAANSSGPEISLTDTTSCADATPPVPGTETPVVRFDWSSPSSSGTTTPIIVVYYLVSNDLIRRECSNGTLVSDRIVASQVAAATAACAPTANCTGTPTSITVTITETTASNGSQYQYSLTGTFRKLIGGGPPADTTPQSVILLGAGATCTGSTNTIDIEGGAKMRVYGDAEINTANGSSCTAMNLANGGSYQAGGTSILQGGSCAGTGCPTTTAYSPAVNDPYAGVSAPPTTGLTSRTGCSGPGLYASGLSITSGTCTLSTGVYVVQNGFSVSNGATLNTGAGGVLIYLMSGQFSIGSANSVTLTAMTSGTWKGIALWQIAADTQEIVIGNGAQTVAINGAIYGPKAQLVVNGGVLPTITAIVVQTVPLSNGITITVGAPSSPGLSISTTSLPESLVNSLYSATMAGAGGDDNYIWSAAGLPAGLSIGASTGIISGTPTATGSSSVTVTLNDQLGDTAASQSYTLTIDAAPTVTSTSPSSRGQGATSQNITITGTGFVNGSGLTTVSRAPASRSTPPPTTVRHRSPRTSRSPRRRPRARAMSPLPTPTAARAPAPANSRSIAARPSPRPARARVVKVPPVRTSRSLVPGS